MKTLTTSILAFVSAMVFAFTAFADTWTDPDTGITWTYTVSDGKASIYNNYSAAIPISTTGAITIPSSFGDYPVTSIGSGAFYECSGLTSVTIPSSVTSICIQAFYKCSGLTSVTIPSNVTSIGSSAFCSCSGLTSVTIPSSVTSIDDCAFMACRGLTSVTIPEGVTSIGDCAFEYCRGLMSVMIPSSVMSIGEYAFNWCSGLTSVTIPSSVTNIGYRAFSHCSIQSFSVEVGNPSYKSQNGLLLTKDGKTLVVGVNGEITIPLSVTCIGEGAFYGCSGLTSVTIPSSVTNIGECAFSYCSGLMSFSIDADNPSYKSANGLLLTKDGTTLIAGVNGDVTIPSSVTSIGWEAFAYCSGLTSVTIPSSVTNIDSRAFACCDSMTLMTFNGAPPNGLVNANIETDVVIRYNAEYEDEWEDAIAECGFTKAISYWPEEKGKVAFVAPNGESSELSHIYTNEVYGVLPEARRDGYTFAGWYTSLEGTTRISAFSKVDPEITTLFARWVENSADLYAQWSANEYTVNFHANGGTGEMSAQPFLYDQSQALFNSAFSKLGYTFKGWATSEDGEAVYGNGECVSNLTAEAGFAIALFAKWEKVIDVDSDTIEEWVGYTLAPKFKKSGESNSQYRKRFESKFGDDYSTAFFMETGKIGMDGTRLCVWHDYVAGTDPTDENDVFKASVTMVDGKVKVSYTPELSAEEANKRVYKTLGKVKLTDTDWVEVPTGSEGDYNFFKVTVEMK